MAVKLSDCNRKELLFVIDYLKRNLFASGDYCLLGALREVECKREQKRYDEANKYNDIAYKKRIEAAEIINKYEGKRIADVPLSDLQRAQKCLKEAQEADRKYEALMNT